MGRQRRRAVTAREGGDHHAVTLNGGDAAILALNAGTPVLPIAYEFKTEELFDRLGGASWVTRIEDMDPQSIVARVESLFDELPERRAVLFEGVAEERKRALIARDLLMKLLG